MYEGKRKCVPIYHTSQRTKLYEGKRKCVPIYHTSQRTQLYEGKRKYVPIYIYIIQVSAQTERLGNTEVRT